MLGISTRAHNCQESATLAITAKAKTLQAQGVDVISFGAGEPDKDPPAVIIDAMIAAVHKSGTAKYVAASGIPTLKDAIIQKLKTDNGLVYAPAQISVNCGAKHSIANVLFAIIDDGDEVVIPIPYWVSYPEMVKLAGGVPVLVGTDDRFILRADMLAKVITQKTKALILNSPSNPTGAVIPKEELQKIADICVERNIYVISDEIYEKIIYDGTHTSIASLGEEIKRRTFTVNGMSKSHAIPGWRLGYVAGPVEEIAALNRIQGQTTSNTTSVVQIAAAASLNHAGDFITAVVKEYRARRDFIVPALSAIPGWSCATPAGAFYVFAKIPSDDDWAYTRALLDEAHVAVVPGTEFGMPGYVRLSYATGMDKIEEGVRRIAKHALASRQK